MKNVADPTIPETPQDNVLTSWTGHRGNWLFGGYVLLGLLVIFHVPRLIPMAPSASDSYLFGYNNRAGILLLFLFVAIGVIWTKGLHLAVSPRTGAARLPRGTLWLALLIVAVSCAAMYLFAGRFNGFGESFYLVDRVWLLHLGKVPFRDFEFAYGPAQLYGPLFLHELLHIGIDVAYYIFWALSYLLGTYFLFKSVEAVDFATSAKKWIFWLLFAAGLFAVVRMGTNYTFLRYALPLYLVLRIERRFRSFHGSSIVLDVIVSGAYCGILILLSPETAVAFAFASLCLCLLARDRSLAARGITAGALILTYAVLFVIALKLHVLDTMLADGGGAISFPIVPSPTILMYFAALFVCACYLYRCLRDSSCSRSTLGLVFFSIPMTAAALSRCDPCHVFWNGLGAFLASLVYVSLHRKSWIVYGSAFAMLVVLLPNVSELYLFGPQLRLAQSYNTHSDLVPQQQKIEQFLGKWRGNYVAPFGFRPGGFATWHSPRIDYGRYEDLIDVSTLHSVAEKVDEMRANPAEALILPYNPDAYCRTNEDNESHYLEALLLFPYIGKFAHTNFVRTPICRYIDSNYRMLLAPSAETFWYGIWVRKS